MNGKHWLGLAAVWALSCGAAEWRDYPAVAPPPEPADLVSNGGFDAGLDGWTVAPGYRWTADGRNGGGAVEYLRADPGDYQVLTRELTGVEPETGYVLSGAAAIADPGVDVSIYVEAYDRSDGKYHHGFYVGTRAHADWNPLEIRFNSGPDAARYRWIVGVYMAKNQTGRVVFDDLSVLPAAPAWQVAQLWPIGESVYAGDGRIELAASIAGEFVYPRRVPAELAVAAEVYDGGRLLAESPATVDDERIRLKFPELAVGDRRLRLTLFDRANRVRLAEAEAPLRVCPPPAGGVTVDRYGRTLVDGEPFMPLGFYLNYPMRGELERLRDTPFNAIMPYASVRMRPDGGGDLDTAAIDDIRAVLDWWHQAGFKVIFSLKDLYPAGVVSAPYLPWRGVADGDAVAQLMVEAFRDHPALLAWYICDEMSVRHRDLLTARRRLINRLDPAHPTWAVFMETEIIAPTRTGYDILGLDPYPIRDGRADSMASIVRFMRDGRDRMSFNGGSLSMWTVPQIFGYQSYGRAADRVPTADEMIAMTLLEAIFGAKGFIFYSYMDIGTGGVAFDEHWARVLELGRTIKALEPFILSIEPAPPFELEVREGDVHARAFAAGGEIRLAIAGVGPGPARAVIRIDAEVVSATGATRKIAPGVYEFTGGDICYDICFSPGG